MKIAVLAVQGAFEEHCQIIRQLGTECITLRQAKDLNRQYDGLILPGGESTVQGKLIRELGMYDTIKKQITEGLPVLATCAGLILLARHLSNDEKIHLGTLPVTVRRNAYGRQLGSFSVRQDIFGGGTLEEGKNVTAAFPMRFIRAPYIEQIAPGVEVMARVKEEIVMVRYQNQLAMSFHPELTADTRIHEMFLKMI